MSKHQECHLYHWSKSNHCESWTNDPSHSRNRHSPLDHVHGHC